MQYATVRHRASPAQPPIYAPDSRPRRNTLEPIGRPQQVMQLIRAEQQQQLGYEFMDDRTNFQRAQRAAEERIHHDNERAIWAQRRDNARKATRAYQAAQQLGPNLPRADGGIAPSAVYVFPRSRKMPDDVRAREKSRLQAFCFPRSKLKTPVLQSGLCHQPKILPKPPQQVRFAFEHKSQNLPPPTIAQCSPSKRLAPIPPFNPYVRPRSESMSSLIENEIPRETKGRKRNASVSALFARINREAENYRFKAGNGARV